MSDAGVPGGRLASILTARRLWRRVFWLYAAALFTATHWPRLELHVPYIERPDLIIHFTAFGSWCALFILAAFIKPLASTRSIILSALAAAAYAAFDEGSQAIPFVHRHAAWDDYLANLGGITIGAVACAILFAAVRPPRDEPHPGQR